MLKVNNVVKYYDENLAVDNLSFTVKAGEIFGLLGINGAGKTTTFRMIMGLLEYNDGTITLDDEIIDYRNNDKIGFLTEERSLLTKMTVYEQMIYYGSLKSMTKKKIEERLDHLLNKFSISEYKYRKIKELSKGNQQKIQLISAILHEPKLIILDEPFSGLDPINVELFKSEIKELSDNGAMIIFSTHRMDHVEELCEKLVILVKGKTVLKGDLNKIKKEFGKMNLVIKGSIDIDKVNKIKGVLNITTNKDEHIVKIDDYDAVTKVFSSIKGNDITKFLVEEPTLNEIFISKVGESYEK